MDISIPNIAYNEWKEEQADEYAQAQRRAFIDGFEAAANEAETFRLLREWLEGQRDYALEEARSAAEDGHSNDHHVAQRYAYIDVLTRLSGMGVKPREDENE